MLEELNYTSVMKPVFSLDRLATTDLTHTIIGASDLTNSVLASDLCRQAPRRRDRIQAIRLVEVKCADVLNCQLGERPSPGPRLPSPTPSPAALRLQATRTGARVRCVLSSKNQEPWVSPVRCSGDFKKRSRLCSLLDSSSLPLRTFRFCDFVWGESGWVGGR